MTAFESMLSLVLFLVFSAVAFRKRGLTASALRAIGCSLGLVALLIVVSRILAGMTLKTSNHDMAYMPLVVGCAFAWVGYLMEMEPKAWLRLMTPMAIFQILPLTQVGLSLVIADPQLHVQLSSLIALGTYIAAFAYIARRWQPAWAKPAMILLAFGILVQASDSFAFFIPEGRLYEQANALFVLFTLFGLAAYVMSHIAPGTPTMRLKSLLVLAIWSSLWLSLAEAGLRSLGHWLAGPLVMMAVDPLAYLPSSAIWMVVVAHGGFFVGLALLLCAGARIAPVITSRYFVVFLFSFLSFFSLFFVFGIVIHHAALVCLDTGIAIACARFLVKRFSLFEGLVRRTIVPLAVCGILVPGLANIFGMIDWHAADATGSTPGAKDADPINVILITLDTVRVQSMSLCGYERPTTPFLEELAEKSVVFDRAICPSSWTLPTHASLFTGTHHHEHRAGYYRPLGTTLPTLAEQLGENGFDTAGFAANTTNCGARTGLARGFRRYEYYERSLNVMIHSSRLWWVLLGGVLPPIRTSGEEINSQFFNWLDNGVRAPFFVFLNYFDAHEPYYVPDESFDIFAEMPVEERHRLRQSWQSRDRHGWSSEDPAEIQLAVDTYDAAIRYMDHHLRLLFDELDKRKLLDKTLIVITTDHGEHFGEHGQFGHGYTLYRHVIEAPVILFCPSRVPQGKRIHDPIGLVNLPATILKILGGDLAGAMPGTSLDRFWIAENPQIGTSSLPILVELEKGIGFKNKPNSDGPITSMVDDKYHYIHYHGEDREELFDFEQDPLEQTNLATQLGYESRLEEYRDWVRFLRPEGTRPLRPGGNSEEAEDKTVASADRRTE